MTKEIAMALGHLSDKINEQGRRIDNLYAQLHRENADNIDSNATGIDGLAEVIDMQNEAINDLATAVSEIES